MTPAAAELVDVWVEPLNVVLPYPNGWSLDVDGEVLLGLPDGPSSASLTLRSRDFAGGWPELRAVRSAMVAELSARPGFRLLDETADPDDLRIRWTFRSDDGSGPRVQTVALVFDGMLFLATCTAAEEEFPLCAELFAAVADGVRGKMD